MEARSRLETYRDKTMTAATLECPASGLLQEILWGKLSDDQSEKILQHIDGCPACAETIEQLSSHGQSARKWRDLIARQVPSSVYAENWALQNEADCAVAVQQLISRSIDSVRETPLTPLEIIGPYRLIRAIGSGGMGTVYLAEHTKLRRKAAVKLLPRERASQPDWVQRFHREMQAVAALEHPNIVRALDAGDQDQWYYLVMEYLEGCDLSHLMARSTNLSAGAACELGRQAAAGLSVIHAVGMVHRDIKPSNLFLTKQGMVKILDLGLVFDGCDPLAQDERLTTLGHLMGTLAYMSPEQINDCRSVEPRSDLYSLGATLYRLLTGEPPHGRAKQIAETIRCICERDAKPLRELRPELPLGLCQLVDGLLARDPEQRPSDAETVSQRLANFADTKELGSVIRAAVNQPLPSVVKTSVHPSVIKPSPPQAGANPPGRGNRWKIIAAAFFGVAASFLAGIFLTIVTDRGELTIRSEQPGLKIEVTQGEQIVEKLTLQSNQETLTLRSGSYAVRLSDVNVDGFRLSNETVVLTRGVEAVVEVTKAPSPMAATADSKMSNSTVSEPFASDQIRVPKFQGKSYEQWSELIYSERDPEVIKDAIQALELLSTAEQKEQAAAASLYPLRIYGSSIIGGNQGDERVHEAITTYFPRYPIEVRLKVLSREFLAGDPKSGMGMIWLWGWNMGPDWNELTSQNSILPLIIEYDRSLVVWIKAIQPQIIDPESKKGDQSHKLAIARQQILLQRVEMAPHLKSEFAEDVMLREFIRDEFQKERLSYENFSNNPLKTSGGQGGMFCVMTDEITKQSPSSHRPTNDALIWCKVMLDPLKPDEIAVCIDAIIWRSNLHTPQAVLRREVWTKLIDSQSENIGDALWQSCKLRQSIFADGSGIRDTLYEDFVSRVLTCLELQSDRLQALQTLAFLSQRFEKPGLIAETEAKIIETVFAFKDGREICVVSNYIGLTGRGPATLTKMLETSDAWWPVASEAMKAAQKSESSIDGTIKSLISSGSLDRTIGGASSGGYGDPFGGTDPFAGGSEAGGGALAGKAKADLRWWTAIDLNDPWPAMTIPYASELLREHFAELEGKDAVSQSRELLKLFENHFGISTSTLQNDDARIADSQKTADYNCVWLAESLRPISNNSAPLLKLLKSNSDVANRLVERLSTLVGKSAFDEETQSSLKRAVAKISAAVENKAK